MADLVADSSALPSPRRAAALGSLQPVVALSGSQTTAPPTLRARTLSPEPAPRETAAAAPSLVADQVYAFVEGEILAGRMPGGSRLRVRQLAELVGTSIQPVRDAISRLEDSGLVTRAPHKGAVVKQFSVPELIDIYSVRKLLEEGAAAEGVRRITSGDLRQMERSLSEMERALRDGRVHDVMRHDDDFLRTLYRASGNAVLIGLIDTLWKQCHYYRIMAATTAYMNGDYDIWLLERDVLQAVRDGDADTAATLVGTAIELFTTALRNRRAFPSAD